MSLEQQQLQAGIQAIEAQRALLGDAVVEASLAGVRARLAALQPSPAPETPQSLRQVSIAFLDMVGSTTLSQRLDPEDIHVVLDGALARLTAQVAAHGGRVLQYAGDSLLAVFGADVAREDDAERAVRCGLALLAQGRLLDAEVLAAHGHAGFNVRVGIHTGGVLLGGGVDGDGTIRGIAVSIAARLEQAAPPGALLISHDTLAQVRGMFEVEAQAPLAVKGLAQPLQSYRVLRAKPRSFRIATRGIEGVTTRMIGREAELAQLQQAFQQLCDQRQLAVITVVADAGMGKSRLLNEFQAWSDARPEVFYLFRGRATPQTQGQPFGLLRDILAWRFQIADDDSLATARLKLAQGISPWFEADEGTEQALGRAHVLGHLVGIDHHDSPHLAGILADPRQIRDRGFHTAAQLLRRVSAGLAGAASLGAAPVQLQLDDLHWADSESLDFLTYLSEVNRDVALLVLGLTRPTLFERRGDFAANLSSPHQRITLQALSPAHSRDLARELLQKLPEIPAALRELLSGGAEGNPFYMEELVKMLIDRGAILTGAERWSVHADRLLATEVPASLTGVLQARLDGLPAAERQTLQQASVIGAVFWDQALLALDAQAGPLLGALAQRELVLPRPDAGVGGLREYAFKHQILHHVTYNTVLKRTRRELHARLADWLASQTGLRARDFLAATAEHYEQAGDETRAAWHRMLAAEHAASRFAHDAALGHVAHALALLDRHPEDGALITPSGDMPRLRWRLLAVRERTLDLQGQRSAQRLDIDALAELAESHDDDRDRADVAWRRSSMAMRLADFALQESAARQAMAWAERAGDNALRLQALRQLALARARLGDLVAGQALAQQGMEEARSLGLKAVEAVCLNTLAIIAWLRQDPVAQQARNAEDLVIRRALGDRRSEGLVLVNLGGGWLDLGALAPALRDLEQGLALVRANGDRTTECGALCNLSTLARWRGDPTQALALASAALETARVVEALDWQATAGVYLGHAELALGRPVEAARAYQAAHALAVTGDLAAQHDASAGLARTALAQGDVAAARQSLQALLDDEACGGKLNGTEAPRHIELTCHRVLAQAGDGRARRWLARAHQHLQATAASITDDALRADFLANIPEHREIVAAWQRDLSGP